jgi:type II secretory pathway component HofQ
MGSDTIFRRTDSRPSGWPRGRTRRRVLAALLALPALTLAQPIEVLTLRHRTADQMLPLLQPLVEPGGALTGTGNQLFLRASPGNAVQIRRLLEQLDRAPRQLLITVRQDRAGESAERSVGADGSVTITTRRSATQIGGSGTVEARDARSVGTRSAEQTLRVLEGARAYITMGTAVPFTFRRWLRQPGGGWVVTQDTVFVEAVTGFYVQPQVSGDLVTLDITPEDATLRGATVEQTRLATRVQVRLGEWVALGGADLQSSSQYGGMLSGGQDSRAAQRGVWVRVDEASDGPPR